MGTKPFTTMLDYAASRTPAVTSTMPNFFIVGAPKAGTTSLYHYLAQHPDVYMSPIKEPNYFAEEIRLGNIDENWQGWARREDQALRQYLSGPMQEKRFGGIVSDWSDYVKLFRNVKGQKAIGEASVCYLWSQTAARNIALAAPDAKIIMVLRDPAQRAFSQYKQAVANGLVGKSFRELIRSNLDSASLNKKTDKFALLHPFLEFGLYYEQVKRFLELFQAANVRIYLYEDFRQATAETVADIFRFVGVDRHFRPDMSEKHLQARMPRFLWVSHVLKQNKLWYPLKNLVPSSLRPAVRHGVFRKPKAVEMDPDDRARLIDYYHDDTFRLSTLIGRDLYEWLR